MSAPPMHAAERILPSGRLIFGCSTITHHEDRQEALRLLGTALDLGIKHFDVARAYGAGEAETVLGEFIKPRRDRVMVTTKYGILPQPAQASLPRKGYERMIKAKPAFSGLHGRLRKLRDRLRPSPYSPARLASSLEASLRCLKTDHVDFLLLHEASVEDAFAWGVQPALRDLVRKGVVKQFGLGSEFRKIRSADAQLPRDFSVLQFEHSLVERDSLQRPSSASRTVFTHSAVKCVATVRELLMRQEARTRQASAALDFDLLDEAKLPGVLLAWSHFNNRSGKVIFSTRSVARLQSNVAVFAEISQWDRARQDALMAFFEKMPRVELSAASA